MSAIRISASGGVCHLSNRMATGDTIITQSAKSTYDGAIATLNSAHRANGFDPASVISHHQTTTTGAADTPHTTAWTAMSDATVQAMRQATTVRDGTLRELTGLTDASHA
jgi:hypothetical protein